MWRVQETPNLIFLKYIINMDKELLINFIHQLSYIVDGSNLELDERNDFHYYIKEILKIVNNEKE